MPEASNRCRDDSEGFAIIKKTPNSPLQNKASKKLCCEKKATNFKFQSLIMR